jgi:hypothetical protein
MVAFASPPSPLDARRQAFAELKERLAGGRSSPRIALEALFPTSIPALDSVLGGGFPSGSLITLEGPESSGRWSIAARLLAEATRVRLAAVIDGGDLYPPTLVQAGVRLERLIVVAAKTPLHIARAADVLLRSSCCSVVVMPAVKLRAAVWLRLAELVHRVGALLIVVGSRAAGELAAAAGVRMECALERVLFHGTRGVWGALAGYALRVDVRKHKRVTIRTCARFRAVEPLAGAAVRERVVDFTAYASRIHRGA